MSEIQDPLVSAVTALTNETTDLLVEYRNIKQGLSGDVNSAASSAKAASDQAGIAATQAVLAKDAATEATNQKTEATKQAVIAKASADKASQVSGLDTVAEAVQVALADSYQYAMTECEFNANREMNKQKYAGSGFVEWGKSAEWISNLKINEGMWDLTTTPSTLYIGRTDNNGTGLSRTGEPVVMVDGVNLHLLKGDNSLPISFPPCPDGTKSYDSATGIVTDHLVGAVDHNAAVEAAFASETETNKVILTRQDLVFLESWYENTSEKQVLLPLGNSQYGATTWKGIPLKKLTALGVGQGYSAFGEWDKETVGYGVRISELTDAQLKKFLQAPKNNIYFDAETGKLIQARYRVRVVEGCGDEWENTQNTKKLNSGMRYSNNSRPSAQGAKEVSTDYNYGSGFYTSSVNPEDSESFAFVTAISESPNYGSKCFALPIALAQRLNSGAYHPVFNPSGCSKFDLKGSWTKDWYAVGNPHAALINTQLCFKNSENNGDFGCREESGYIGNFIGSGRPSSFPDAYYDAVYAHQIKDLRLSAHKQDVNKLRVDTERKDVAGESRGWGKVPFTKNDMTVKMLTPENDMLAYIDIFGTEADIKKAFANGVAGLVNNKSGGELMRKTNGSTAEVIVGDGTTWTQTTANVNVTTNSINITVPSGKVALVSYPTLSNFTQPANNSNVVGAVGDVTVTTRHEVKQGNRLYGSLLGNIGKDTSNALTDVSKTRQTTMLIEHVPHDFTTPANKSTGCKVATSIIEKDGLLYSQYQAIEIVNNSTDWGDTSNAITVVNGDSTHTDDNGTTVKVVNHIGMIPLGIASYSDSSQSAK